MSVDYGVAKDSSSESEPESSGSSGISDGGSSSSEGGSDGMGSSSSSSSSGSSGLSDGVSGGGGGGGGGGSSGSSSSDVCAWEITTVEIYPDLDFKVGSFTVVNTGEVPVTIESFFAALEYWSVDPPAPWTLLPGGFQAFEMSVSGEGVTLAGASLEVTTSCGTQTVIFPS